MALLQLIGYHVRAPEMRLWLLGGLTVSAKPRWEAGHGELPYDLGNELLPLEPSAGFVRTATEVSAVDSGTDECQDEGPKR